MSARSSMTRVATVVALLGATILLAGCSAGTPSVSPTSSVGPVDHTEQSLIDGEWTITRTVVSTDDKNNPAHAVGAASVREVLFSDVECRSGPCTGTVASGPTTAVRDTSSFTSSGNTISYDFTGYLNCLSPADGSVVVSSGYQFQSHVELKVTASTGSGSSQTASHLEGTLHYTDTVTNDALAAGCARVPETSVTEFTLVGVRPATK
jgi:hypothetical protein